MLRRVTDASRHADTTQTHVDDGTRMNLVQVSGGQQDSDASISEVTG